MKTTKRDFALFREQFEYWIHRMGLLTWEYGFQHSITETKGLAEVVRNFGNKIITVRLAIDWKPEIVSHKSLCRVAFHEAHEVKYANFSRLLSTFYSDSLTDEMVHEMIRLDESYIFEPYYEEKYGD